MEKINKNELDIEGKNGYSIGITDLFPKILKG